MVELGLYVPDIGFRHQRPVVQLELGPTRAGACGKCSASVCVLRFFESRLDHSRSSSSILERTSVPRVLVLLCIDSFVPLCLVSCAQAWVSVSLISNVDIGGVLCVLTRPIIMNKQRGSFMNSRKGKISIQKSMKKIALLSLVRIVDNRRTDGQKGSARHHRFHSFYKFIFRLFCFSHTRANSLLCLIRTRGSQRIRFTWFVRLSGVFLSVMIFNLKKM